MKVVAIIQARMGSTRLPGKVLAGIQGRPMLWHVVQRVRRAKTLNQIVVATTTQRTDDAIADFCSEQGFDCFRGSENDVLGRYYQASREYGADAIVRITSDCPLIDPEIVDRTVWAFLEESPDYASNSIVCSFPRGLDVEVMSLAALEVAWREATQDYQRAHVTPYLYENPRRFKILSVAADGDYSTQRWTVDTREDLEFVRTVYSRFEHQDFLFKDVLRSIEREPAIAEINRSITQKALQEAYSLTRPVLVAGAGSIGRRHLGNLRKLGLTQLAVCDPDAARQEYAASEFQVQCFSTFEAGLKTFQPELVLVCTPPVHHIPQAKQALQGGAHVFIEKPVSDKLDGVIEIEEQAVRRGLTVQVGYNLRFNPGIQLLKRLTEEGVPGRILWARAEVAQYLPEWRPWQDYRESYTARRELGGGIILDASHEIDYMLWLLGAPRELACMAGQVGGMDVNVEDCATILIRFASGAQADIHMDFVQRNASRLCVLAGESATLEWYYARNEVSIIRPGNEREIIKYEFETNQMYVAELDDFLSRVHDRRGSGLSLAGSKLALEVALAALQSASERRWVSFEK
jgi:spore coat polysaccharide biosynthesis protein SpsF